jgi:hypothetical protein
MPVVDRVGPLPDGRPAKGFSIIFGMKRPESAEKKLTEEKQIDSKEDAPDEDRLHGKNLKKGR